MEDKQALLAALNTLIASDDARHLFQTLTAVVNLKVVHAVALDGEAAVLNPLVDIGRTDPERFERLIAKVDGKRREALKAPLVEPKDDGFNKTEYMREFMYQKRLRMRRAAEIENKTRSPKDALIGRSRLDFMEAQAAKWKLELDRRIEVAREANGGARLPKDTMDTVRTQFWSYIDEQLDAADAAATLRILTA